MSSFANNPAAKERAPACLGCRECSGLCRSLLELVALPEAVLAHAPR